MSVTFLPSLPLSLGAIQEFEIVQNIKKMLEKLIEVPIRGSPWKNAVLWTVVAGGVAWAISCQMKPRVRFYYKIFVTIVISTVSDSRSFSLCG